MPRVLCTALSAESGPHFDILQASGFDCHVVDRATDLFQPAELIRALSGYDAVIAGSEPYPRSVLESLPQLRVIVRAGVGFDAVDVRACDDCDVVLATTPGVNHESVAEHAVAMLLALARGLPTQDRAVRSGKWTRTALPRVAGSTLGLIGLGRIGRAVAWRARGLGMTVLACESHPDAAFVAQHEIAVVSLEELLRQSDFVSLHVPVTSETTGLINARTLAAMKPGSVLLNTARGQLVDQAALLAALRSGHLRAAGLDVFETEPVPPTDELCSCEQVLLSGHVAGLDQQSHADTWALAARILQQLHSGQWPADCIQNCRDVCGWSWAR